MLSNASQKQHLQDITVYCFAVVRAMSKTNCPLDAI